MTDVCGLDQSLTSFGAARASSTRPVELARWQPGKRAGHDRLQWLLGHVEEFTDGCDFVVVEGLSFGARGSSLLDLAGLKEVICHRLWQLKIPYVLVAPTLRAKYITGKGNADKEACLIQALKRFPAAGVCGNDQADALTLAAMGMDWAGSPLAVMPAAHRAVLTAMVPATRTRPAHPAIRWPVFAVA